MTDTKELFANRISDKGLLSRIYFKELKLNIKIINPIRKQAKDGADISLRKMSSWRAWDKSGQPTPGEIQVPTPQDARTHLLERQPTLASCCHDEVLATWEA